MQRSQTVQRIDTQTTKPIDYKALEEGRLFIRRRDGQLVNASTDAVSFDEAISEYVNLFDRATWPTSERALLFTMAYNTIPLQVQDDITNSTTQEGHYIHD